ncbi:metal-dependent hydrolase family protein [Actinacidiphila acidipaludis]|uniref:Amidohydrolase family protein n=1 Tax=Actinacidiphila acidipaludis TaxID=2873382 RepID=A0ABS7Q9V0_9ACTN|nr:amidohydrolase family protein [Streptomyces acidipaludis]MBY8879939.1 amidohydrolase family protein [Streptomyces acidipaludis]
MKTLALHAGSMFDGFSLSDPATVYVAGDRIVRVDREGALPADGTALVDFGTEACLLPGLIDTHVHLAFDAGPDPVASLAAMDDETLLAHMRDAARSALDAGITTLRDLGDRDFLSLKLVEELAGRPELGPEILPAGPPLTVHGGHCHFLGGEVEGAEALRAAVRERHARGCRVIKIMASGGHMTPDSVPPHVSQYSLADLRVVVDEAHGLGLPVAAHVHGVQAVQDAVEAGVDSLEHLTFLTSDGAGPDEGLLKTVADSGSFVSLTVGSDPGKAVQPHGDLLKHVETMRKAWTELRALGADVVVGSDAGIAPFKPHDVLPHGVRDLQGFAGMTPLEALTAVTSVAARACRVEGRKGQIAPGADADILAVHGNPVADPAALFAIEAVFRAGVQVRGR